MSPVHTARATTSTAPSFALLFCDCVAQKKLMSQEIYVGAKYRALLSSMLSVAAAFLGICYISSPAWFLRECCQKKIDTMY